MIKNFFSMFTQSPDQLANQMLDEAHTKALAHAAEAEYHQAMAEMYAKRLARLMVPANPEVPQ